MAINARFAADFSSFQDAVRKAEVQLQGFEGNANKVQKSLGSLTDQFSGRRLIQEATLMAEAVQRVGGISALTGKELQTLGGTAQEAAEKFRATGKSVPTDIQAIADAAKKASGNIDDASNSLTRLLTGFVSMTAIVTAVRGTTEFANNLQRMSSQSKLGTTALQELSYAGKLVNVSIDTISGSLGQMQSRLAEGGDASAIGAIKKLGLNIDEVRTKGPEAFFDIARAIDALPDSFERARRAREVFGRGGVDLLPVIENLDAMRQKAHDVGAVMSDETVKSLGDLNNALDTLSVAGKKALGDVLVPATPALKNLADAAATGAHWIAELWRFASDKSGLSSFERIVQLGKDWNEIRKNNLSMPGGLGLPGPTAPSGASAADIANQKRLEAIAKGGAGGALPVPLVPPEATTEIDALSHALDRDLESSKRLRTEWTQQQAALKAFAAGTQELLDVETGVGQVFKDVSGSVVEAVKYYLAAGVSQGTLATQYALTAIQVKLLAEATANYTRVLQIEAGAGQTTAEALKKISELGISQDPQRAAAEAATVDRMHEIERSVIGIGNDLGKLGTYYPPLTDAAQKTLDMHERWLKALDSLSATFAQMGQIAGDTFNAIAQGIGGIISGISLAAKSLDSFYEAGASKMQKFASLASFGGAIGSIVGIGVGGLIDLFRGSEESRMVNQPREQFVQAAGGLAALNAKAQAATGSLQIVKDLLNAKTAEDYKKAVDAINTAFEQFKQKSAAAHTTLDGLNTRFSKLVTLTPELQAALDKTFDANNIDDYITGLEGITGVLDTQEKQHQHLIDLMGEYGLKASGASKEFQQGESDRSAQKLIADFRELSAIFPNLNNLMGTGMSEAIAAAGGNSEALAKVFGDLSSITGGMGANVEAFYLAAKKAGLEVPEEMRKVIQTAIDSGQLFDENGRKITDMKDTGLIFGESMQKTTKDLQEVMLKLAYIIDTKIGGAFDSAANTAADAAERAYKAWKEKNFGQFLPTGAGGAVPAPAGASTGGVVLPFGVRGFARGGWSGTDTVPALLTPGELVLNKQQQARLFGGGSHETVRLEIPVIMDGREVSRIVIADLDQELRKRRRLRAA